MVCIEREVRSQKSEVRSQQCLHWGIQTTDTILDQQFYSLVGEGEAICQNSEARIEYSTRLTFYSDS
jgi:hypothetical protein